MVALNLFKNILKMSGILDVREYCEMKKRECPVKIFLWNFEIAESCQKYCAI